MTDLRVTGTTTSCLECPHRINHDCGKTGQNIREWMQRSGPKIPRQCPLPVWPKFEGVNHDED